ncbi:MAG TPA: GvpL/GvpF family gas vesicle protein [Solirubrobacteraceae bacterium]|nr:GvpL/GvpF family gas vesicle protein [Solirubrobacteraceae bacterium]
MTLLLYAITDGRGRLDGASTGVQNRPVRAVATPGLTAMVSEHDGIPSLDAATAWSFERVVEALMKDAAVLPARFGTAFAEPGAVRDALAARTRALTAALDRVRDRVEVSVRVIAAARAGAQAGGRAPSAPRSGRDYMLARLGPEREARALADRVGAELDPLAVASRYRLRTRAEVPVAASFLVDHGDTAAFVRRAGALGDGLAGVDVVCTGPWPPYSFVGEDDDV